MEMLVEMHAAADALAHCFMDSWNGQNGPGYGSAYWEDAELVDPTGCVWEGREEIEAMHAGLWEGPAAATSVRAKVRRVRPLSPTLMVVDLDITVRGFEPPPPGASVLTDGSLHTRLKHVVEKRGEDWKIIASQNTFVTILPM